AQDLDAMADEMSVGVAQGGVAADLKGDVAEPDLTALRALRPFGRRMLANVEGVEVVAQGHEHAAVLGIFFGDHKAEHIAVKPLRDLLVGDPQIDVADAFQLYHGCLRDLCDGVAKVRRAVPAPQGAALRAPECSADNDLKIASFVAQIAGCSSKGDFNREESLAADSL